VKIIFGECKESGQMTVYRNEEEIMGKKQEALGTKMDKFSIFIENGW
jgi:hypothetical protein